MRAVRVSTIASFAFVAISSLFSITGCIESSFGGAGPGYDQQACLERALRRSPDPETVARASEAFKKECREGGAEACSALGVMNEVGVGVPVNIAHAIQLYQRSCRAGNSRGCTNLGVAQAEGIGMERDAVAAVRLLEPECGHSDARACFYLARLHESGEGTAKDLVVAAQLMDAACTGEEAAACVALGDMRAKAGQRDGAWDSYDKGCALGDKIACSRIAIVRSPAGQEIATAR